MDPVAAKFLEYGVTGACVLVLAYVLWKMSRAYNDLQNKRVDEAKAVTDKILALSEDWQNSLNEVSKMVEKHSNNVSSLRDECRERTEGVAQMIRDMIGQLRRYAEELQRRTGEGGSRQ